MVKLPKEQRANMSDLDELLVRTPRGGEMPLREAAIISEGHVFSDQSQRQQARLVGLSRCRRASSPPTR